MEPRICTTIISEMVSKIPESEIEFIKDLQWNYEDASYKAPEETIQWNRTYQTIVKHIPKPKQDWEFEVLSIFSTMTVENIKEIMLNE